MKSVFVLDTNKRPNLPVHPAAARRMLKTNQAAIYRKHPFTIIVKNDMGDPPETLRLKIDPGSRTTGLAVVNDCRGDVVWIGELRHRGPEIKKALDKRRALRHGRRNRNLRYRPARFNNRGKDGWLAPSLMSRVCNVETWVKRLRSAAPIGAISVEIARFDMQLMENPEITGVEYQQGELAGYEVREYLLEKFHRKCVYCGKSSIPLQVEHILPKSRGGSNRTSNLTIACEKCNQAKGNRTATEFGCPEVEKQARMQLRDAAMMNATRLRIQSVLELTGLPVETGTGGRTKFNRTRAGLEKTHWADAACVGESTPEQWHIGKGQVHTIRARSYARRGRRQACLVDKYGFPRQKGKFGVRSFGYQTSDVVTVKVKKGKWAGIHKGRIAMGAVRSVFSPKLPNGPSSFNNSDILKLVDRCGSFEYERCEIR